jgi:hypothetical protein
MQPAKTSDKQDAPRSKTLPLQRPNDASGQQAAVKKAPDPVAIKPKAMAATTEPGTEYWLP